MTIRGLLALLAFIAAAVFSGFWVFGATLGAINLEAATLFSLSLGFVFQALPENSSLDSPARR